MTVKHAGISPGTHTAPAQLHVPDCMPYLECRVMLSSSLGSTQVHKFGTKGAGTTTPVPSLQIDGEHHKPDGMVSGARFGPWARSWTLLTYINKSKAFRYESNRFHIFVHDFMHNELGIFPQFLLLLQYKMVHHCPEPRPVTTATKTHPPNIPTTHLMVMNIPPLTWFGIVLIAKLASFAASTPSC